MQLQDYPPSPCAENCEVKDCGRVVREENQTRRWMRWKRWSDEQSNEMRTMKRTCRAAARPDMRHKSIFIAPKGAIFPP